MNLIDEIIASEWEMFQATQNNGGRASCQENYKTFYGMRYGQCISWSEDVRLCYMKDLKTAQANGRNLIAEKYLRMMESTHPEEYLAQKHLLPNLSESLKWFADTICAIIIAQTVPLRESYPLVGNAGRPLYSHEDSPYATSVETYQRGELYTYSEETLQALHHQINEQQQNNISMAKNILENTIKSYGFDTLENAENTLATRI